MILQVDSIKHERAPQLELVYLMVRADITDRSPISARRPDFPPLLPCSIVTPGVNGAYLDGFLMRTFVDACPS